MKLSDRIKNSSNPGLPKVIGGLAGVIISILAYAFDIFGISAIYYFVAIIISAFFALKGASHLYRHVGDDIRTTMKERWGVDGLACFDAMMHMCVADGKLHRKEMWHVKEISKRFFGKPASNAEIEHAADAILTKSIKVENVLGPVVDQLKYADKKMIMKAAFLVLKADGNAEQSEKQMLGRIVSVLGLTQDDLTQLIVEFVDD